MTGTWSPDDLARIDSAAAAATLQISPDRVSDGG
jgi:hypothetical protein